MKKILLLLIVILLHGCSNSLEDFAKERSVEYLNDKTVCFAKAKKVAIEYFNIDSLTIVLSNDSICVVDLSVKAKLYGEKEKHDRLQYIIFKDFFQSKAKGNGVYYEYADNADYYRLYKIMQNKAIEMGFKGMSFYESVMEIRNDFTEVPTK